MERMKLWLIPVYAMIGFLIVIAVMPRTSWVLRTDVDSIIASRKTLMAIPPAAKAEGLLDYWEDLYPLGPEADDKATDEDSEYLKLALACQKAIAPAVGPDERTRRFTAFFRFCKQHNTREFWAQFVRYNYAGSQIPDSPEQAHSAEFVSRRGQQNLMIQACEAGKSLDLSNGFFSIMEAGALFNLGDVTGARRELNSASQSSRFDEYTSFEIDARYRWFLARYGYRGNAVKTTELAAVLFPHFAAMKGICRHVIAGGKPEDRVAALRLGTLLMRRSSTLIGMLVGRSIVSVTLMPPIGRAVPKELTDDELKSVTAKLQAQIPGSDDLATLLATYKALKPPFKYFPAEDVSDFSGTTSLFLGTTAILALVLMPLALLATRAKLLGQQVSAATPYLIWIAALIAGRHDQTAVAPAFAAGSLLFIPALFDGARRVVDILGILLAGLSIICAAWFQSFEVLAVTTPFLVSLALQRRVVNIPPEAVTIVFVLMLSLVAGLSVWELGRYGPGDAWTLCASCFIAGVAFVPARAPFRWQPSAGVTCLVIGITYGYALTRALADDKALRKVNQLWMNEASVMRDSLGIH